MLEQVSDAQYLWVQLRAKAIMGDWVGVKALVENKSFFSSTPKSCIGFVPFVEIVVQNNGPPDLLVCCVALTCCIGGGGGGGVTPQLLNALCGF
jgi:hypothetical protein